MLVDRKWVLLIRRISEARAQRQPCNSFFQGQRLGAGVHRHAPGPDEQVGTAAECRKRGDNTKKEPEQP